MTTPEQRRYPRAEPELSVTVYDAVEERVLGRLGNISSRGLMIISSEPIDEDLLVQLRFTLSDGQEKRTIEVGAESLWCSSANVPGRYWSGFEIVDISPADETFLSAFSAE